MNHRDTWSRKYGAGHCLLFATVDLPLGCGGTLAPGLKLPHWDTLVRAPEISGLRFNLAKGWVLGNAYRAITRARAHGKHVMVDIISRLRIVARDGCLVRMAPGETLTVVSPDATDQRTPEFSFTRPVDLARLRPGQPVIFRDRRAEGRVLSLDSAAGSVTIRVTYTDTGDAVEFLSPPVNLPGVGAPAWSLAAADREYVAVALRAGADLIAVSFVETPEAAAAAAACVAEHARALSAPEAVWPTLVVKMETGKGIANLTAILRAVREYPGGAAIEVARGDLMNEVPLTEFARAQDSCFSCGALYRVPVGVATGILGSMQRHPVPTRAELLDVHYALRREPAFLLLADETANEARHPREAIRTLADLVRARGTAVRRCFCLAGVPGSGKSTLRHALLRRNPLDVVFLSRVTTRPVRTGEENEVTSFSHAEFVAASRAGYLTARFCGNRAMYAVDVRELEERLQGPQRWIGCLSASAALALLDRGYSVTTIYLTVQNRSVLVRRLRERGLPANEIAMRMHEYDDADAEWRDLSADVVLHTDELSIEGTVERVAHTLGLPIPSP